MNPEDVETRRPIIEMQLRHQRKVENINAYFVADTDPSSVLGQSRTIGIDGIERIKSPGSLKESVDY